MCAYLALCAFFAFVVLPGRFCLFILLSDSDTVSLQLLTTRVGG